jgi:hypothetical protein
MRATLAIFAVGGGTTPQWLVSFVVVSSVVVLSYTMLLVISRQVPARHIGAKLVVMIGVGCACLLSGVWIISACGIAYLLVAGVVFAQLVRRDRAITGENG